MPTPAFLFCTKQKYQCCRQYAGSLNVACIIVSPSFCVTSSCFPKIATLISEGDVLGEI